MSIRSGSVLSLCWLLTLGALALPREGRGQDLPVLLPGASDLQMPGVSTSVQQFHWVVPDSNFTIARGWELTERTDVEGVPALLLTTEGESGGQTFGDSLFLNANTLQPLSEVMWAGGKRWMFQFAGPRVSYKIEHADSAASMSETDTLSVSPFAFNQLNLIVQSLPLRSGYEAILPLYSEGTQQLDMDSVRVQMISPDKIWTIRFADPRIVATYRLRERDRKIVGYEHVLRRNGSVLKRVDDEDK